VRGGRSGLALRDLSLTWKVTLTLTGTLLGIMAIFLLVLLPFQRQQRTRLLTHDQRLLSILREKYARDLIYDLLSENRESLAADVADLAKQPDILWVRVTSEVMNLSATGDRQVQERILRPEALAVIPRGAVLLVDTGGLGRVVGTGGRTILSDQPVLESQFPPLGLPSQEGFEEKEWSGRAVLWHQAGLKAAEDAFGHLDIVFSLVEERRAESQTRALVLGLAGTTFLVLLALLNFQLMRVVIGPVRRVQLAMSEASKGRLGVRLPVESHDEIGRMAEAFNGMVGDLATSKQEIEEYSRNLEAMVLERTQKLQASEQELRNVKNHLETVISHVATGVVSLDHTGRVTTFNDRACEILALPRPPEKGSPIEEALPVRDEALLSLIRVVREGRARLNKGEVSLRLPQGRRILSVVASTMPGTPEGNGGTVVVFNDVTKILASQRLEAWKEAVERVIHEIKNPLTPVGLAAQALRTAHAEDKKRFEEMFPSAIEIIISSVKSLKDLISEFTKFSRLPKGEFRKENLNALVSAILAPYEQSAIEGVAIRRLVSSDVVNVELDRAQLTRALLNVINNAVEAMEGRGGVLTVGTKRGQGQVTIWVTDEGVGMEDVERVFEPYYTTKVKGTGLGLAIARQIVEEHAGEISIHSQADVGTTVEILLPVVGNNEKT